MKIGIVAHTSRREMAHQLAKDVEADYISVDGDWGEPIGSALNHRRVWELLARFTGQDEYAVVLEDDAIVVPNFRHEAELALKSLPRLNNSTHSRYPDVVSFYLGKKYPPHWQDETVPQAISAARRNHAHWLVGDVLLHGVATAIKGEFVGKMLLTTLGSPRPFDEAITQWVRRFGHRVAYTFPSLVNHNDMVPSIAKHPDGQHRALGRVAYEFGVVPHWNSTMEYIGQP